MLSARSSETFLSGVRQLFQKRVRAVLYVAAGLCALGLTGFAAGARPWKVVANSVRSSPLTATQRKWLPAEWEPFLAYTRVFSIQNSKRKGVVLLVSPNAPRYYRAQAGKSVAQVQLPHALLFTSEGEAIGSLPSAFPEDPPAELRVTFTDWKAGFPQRIELFETDPRASGNRALPELVWDASRKTFVKSQEGHHG
jgi:hypothetical protein